MASFIPFPVLIFCFKFCFDGLWYGNYGNFHNLKYKFVAQSWDPRRVVSRSCAPPSAWLAARVWREGRGRGDGAGVHGAALAGWLWRIGVLKLRRGTGSQRRCERPCWRGGLVGVMGGRRLWFGRCRCACLHLQLWAALHWIAGRRFGSIFAFLACSDDSPRLLLLLHCGLASPSSRPAAACEVSRVAAT